MKKQFDLQLLAALCGGILINYLFWMQNMGLNVLLYSFFVIAMLVADKDIPKSRNMLIAGCSHLLASILVIVNYSALTAVTWYISMAVMVGVTHFQSLKSLPAILIAAFLQAVTVPVNLLRKINFSRYLNFSAEPLLRPVKYIVIPAVALILFSTLYSIANPVFAEYLHSMMAYVSTVFTNIFNFFFTELSFLRFLHVIIGILLTAAILIGFKDKTLEKVEAEYSDVLERRRASTKRVTLAYEIIEVFAGDWLRRKMALKTENTIGILTFSLLNVLIFLLNLLDFGDLLKDHTSADQLSSELHGGTYALIVSVILAMLVILYFFSANLNFYRKNKVIRMLAYIWLFQNLVLVVSVLLRDFQYIHSFGLTYKRIGVMVFLLLCTIGLTTVYIKVAARKTFYYLCRVNTLAWYILLLAFGCINWDGFIVNYNIAKRETIKLDVHHLMSLSDTTLPLLHKNRALLTPYLSEYSADQVIHDKVIDTAKTGVADKTKEIARFENDLRHRMEVFRSAYQHSSWLSWNYRDWQTYLYLRDHRL